jgi:hypothetical protein
MNTDIPRAPDFVVIGAAKSGTTSIYQYLLQHPGIAMARLKEARYLGYQGALPAYRGYGRRGQLLMRRNASSMPKDAKAYQKLFSHASAGQRTGESSPAYLYEPFAGRNMYSTAPKVRLIAILRNPLERAYSSYLHMRREDAEPLNFLDALRQEKHRIRNNAGLPWRYISLGRYAEQLRRYYDVFPQHQLLVIVYEELRADPIGVCQQIFRHIGVDDQFRPNVTRAYNVSGEPRHPFLYSILFLRNPVSRRFLRSRWLFRHSAPLFGLERKMLMRPQMDESSRSFLISELRDDICDLEGMLKRDLGFWLN